MSADGDSTGNMSAIEQLRSHMSSGNARPVLTEILAALERLVADGEETIIDLGAIPFLPGDERLMDMILGDGEVSATIEAMGRSHVAETGIPGVWRIDHFDTKGETVSRFVEVCFVPSILKTQREDAEIGIETLTARLEEHGQPKHEKEAFHGR